MDMVFAFFSLRYLHENKGIPKSLGFPWTNWVSEAILTQEGIRQQCSQLDRDLLKRRGRLFRGRSGEHAWRC